MHILTVVGARPQFVKAATVSRAIRRVNGTRETLVHTGQHYDENMSGLFFEELDIPEPDVNLGIGSGNHGAQTGRMLAAIEDVVLSHKPDWVLVYGDTNSTLAGTLAAVKLHVPVAHVEAGLRSFNRIMPEEINRVLTDHCADLLFAPTENAVRNLQKEGLPSSAIIRTGDVMYDAALFYGGKSEQRSRILEELNVPPAGYVLATLHRAENTDDPERLAAIFSSLDAVSKKIFLVLPLHPRTRAALERHGLHARSNDHMRIIDPVGYLDMVKLERNARAIVTDSGGVQKEAFFYKVPCVTLRTETEWTELVDLGWNTLAPPEHGVAAVTSSILFKLSPPQLPHPDIYGDGHAADQIVAALMQATVTPRPSHTVAG